MALSSSKGGNIITAANVVVPNKSWRGNWQAQDDDVTQSDNPGGTLYLPLGVTDPDWEAILCRDDAAFPEAVGWQEGTVLSVIYFKLGSTNKADKVTNTTVKSIETVVEQGKVVMCTVRGHGGVRTANQNLPS